MCFSKLSPPQLPSNCSISFWLTDGSDWIQSEQLRLGLMTSWSYITSCYSRAGFYVQSHEEEQKGSFWQLQGDTIWGYVFNQILSWGSRRNKSVDCTFSSSFCQAYALRISVVAARLKNSSKQLRAAEKYSPNGVIQCLSSLPAWLLCLLSRKTPVRSTVTVHLELIDLCIYINLLFVVVAFVLASYFFPNCLCFAFLHHFVPSLLFEKWSCIRCKA